MTGAGPGGPEIVPRLIVRSSCNFWFLNYHMSGFAQNYAFEMRLVDVGMEDAFDAITR